MPAEGVAWQPRANLLTFEEIERVVSVLVEGYGIDAIRLTGGEPTVRADLARLVERLSTFDVDLSMTTNGGTLASVAGALRDAGLRRVNISLDTLRPDRFAAVARRDALGSVLAGIDAAVAVGFDPVKVNVLAMRGFNEDEIVDLARFGRDRGVTIRFIEFMPLDAEGAWDRDRVVTYDEILERVHAVFPLEACEQRGSSPAERFRYVDGAGELGVVPSVTRAFCDSCDRIRLTADGQFRTCLFALDEHDLRGPLRSGASDDELAELVRAAVGAKWAGHQINNVAFIRPSRSMSQIGG